MNHLVPRDLQADFEIVKAAVSRPWGVIAQSFRSCGNSKAALTELALQQVGATGIPVLYRSPQSACVGHLGCLEVVLTGLWVSERDDRPR